MWIKCFRESAMQFLLKVLQLDPDHKDSQKMIKVIKRLNGLKEEGTKLNIY